MLKPYTLTGHPRLPPGTTIKLNAKGRVGRHQPTPAAKFESRVLGSLPYLQTERGCVCFYVDYRVAWPEARRWIQMVQTTEVEIRLRFQPGEYLIDGQTELRLPHVGDASPLLLDLADVGSHLDEVKDRVVRLRSPDTATVDDVWQAALTLKTAGARGIVFE